MLNIRTLFRNYRETGTLAEHASVLGFLDDSCFITKTGAVGAVLRVDGDTGTLTGSYRDGKFVLSHFSGARPALLTITPQPDGTLGIELAG